MNEKQYWYGLYSASEVTSLLCYTHVIIIILLLLMEIAD